MSVPEGQRGHGKLEVLIKAKNLASYTIKICCNEKVFTPQYQNAITNDLIQTATNIFKYGWMANNIMVEDKDEQMKREKYLQRRKLQEMAALECNNLLALMQIAQEVFHLKTKRIKYWGENTIEVRKMLRGWIEADKKRYS